MTLPELFQFEFSHYNEKARWALDYKRVSHVRHSYLPGPHAISIRRLSGQTMVPVLRDDGLVIAGSARLIAHLEATRPQPPLFPADEAERRRALEIQDWFDQEVRPQIRVAFFFELFPDRDLAASMFAYGKSDLKKAAYRRMFPLMVPLLNRLMRIDAHTAADGRERTRKAFDFVVREAGPEGYLAGRRFSIADLTAASLLLPAVFPPEVHVRLPEPKPAVLAAWLARWKDHPGAGWVRDMYRRHRGSSAEVRR